MSEDRKKRLVEASAKYAPDRENLPKLVSSLLSESSDFTTAPASTLFHGNYPGGLFDHSEHVYKRLLSMRQLLANPYSEETAFVAGMFHDLCKTHFYEPAKRSIKNPKTRKWEDVDGYVINDLIPIGHGEKSAYLAEMYMHLKPEELYAIRWHMGAFGSMSHRGTQDVIDVWNRYKGILPVILFTHLADSFASYIDENDQDDVTVGGSKMKLPPELKIDGLGENKHVLRGQLPVFPEGTSDADRFLGYFDAFLLRRKNGDYLRNDICMSDFFTAPASDKNYYAEKGGLCKMSLRVFEWLVDLADYANWPVKIESVAAVGLLHGLGSIGTFSFTTKQKKNEKGEWETVPTIVRNEYMPYGGLGEKSVYEIMAMGFRLTREEAMALRWIEGALACAMAELPSVPSKSMTAKLAYTAFNFPPEVNITGDEAVPPGTSDKDHYITLFKTYLGRRDGSQKLLSYLCGNKSNFFVSPASDTGPYAYEGGLCRRSLDIWYRMQTMNSLTGNNMPDDMVAAIALLHGLGGINTWYAEEKHRKDENGEWVPFINIYKDEELLFGGLGEKSVYIAQSFIYLSAEEAMAIRWIEGNPKQAYSFACSKPFELFPFAFLAHAAFLLSAYC